MYGYRRLILALCVCVLVACGSNATPTAPTQTDPAPHADPARLPWEHIVAQANGATVNFHMWGGSEGINRYITAFVAPELKATYNITLNQVTLDDIVTTITMLRDDKAAGKATGGAADLVWINGENFRTAREGKLLYGPWAEQIPNAALIPWDNVVVASDFGYPVDGYEAPWGRAQYVFVHDAARVPDPPKSFKALLAWAKEHPGRLTFPALPDYAGSTFVRMAFYELAGGYRELLGPFNQQVYDAKSPALWAYFKELRPYLWQKGELFPKDTTELDALFAAGEIDFSFNATSSAASGMIEKGAWPPTTRTFLLDAGTIANTHYVAIPFNSNHKAAAMVVANVLQSPPMQLEKFKPAVWGDSPAIDLAKLAPADKALFAALPAGVATISSEELAAHAQPELQRDWLERIEQDWQTYVLDNK